MIVPKHLCKAFIDHALSGICSSMLSNVAMDVLPQYDGVMEGDWMAAGIDMNEEFPAIPLLENKFGKEWEEFRIEWKTSSLRRDDGLRPRDVNWVLPVIDEDTFDKELEEIDYDMIRDLDTEEQLREFFDEFAEKILALIEEAKEEGEEESE